MRGPRRFLALGFLGIGGCSVFVAQTGTDLSQFRTKEQVLMHFGAPVEDDPSKQPEYALYHTREKVATDEMTQTAETPAYFLTMGLYELYALPREVYYLTKRTIFGQTLEFQYDRTGRVISIRRDGEDMRWFKFLGPDDPNRGL